MQKHLTIPRLTVTEEERFWSKVDCADSGCWEWRSAINSAGYGKITIDSRSYLAHRVAYTLTHGPINDGMVIDHLCRNTVCVNPLHLEMVSNKVNTWERGYGALHLAYQTNTCKRGHAISPLNMCVEGGVVRCMRCRCERQALLDHQRRGSALRVYSDEDIARLSARYTATGLP